MTLGEKLQRLRKARGMSQEELAAQMGVSRQAVSRWELNIALPDTENVVRLSELFGVTTDYLLKQQEAGENRPRSRGTRVQRQILRPAAGRRHLLALSLLACWLWGF